MIKKIAVIGTGVIGTGWIVRFLAHNKKIIAFDQDLKSEKKLSLENHMMPIRITIEFTITIKIIFKNFILPYHKI